MIEETFQIWIKFKESENFILDTDWAVRSKITSSIERLLHGPAGVMGIISEIRVIDKDDMIVLQFNDGKVTFPIRLNE